MNFPLISLILHLAPLLVSLDSSLDSFCSRLACENNVWLDYTYMFMLCICIYMFVCIFLDICIYPHKYIISVALVRMSNSSFAAPSVVAGRNEPTPDRTPLAA